MNKRATIYTIKYTLVNLTYFACYCTLHAYTAVFLLGRGFSNTSIGLVLCLANVISALLQPVVAAVVDRGGFFTNKRTSILCAALLAALCLVLYFVRLQPVIFIVYLVAYSIQMIYQPLIMAMGFEYNAAGAGLNFGLARGLGSVGFAATSAIVGNVLVGHGVSSLQVMNMALLLLGILTLVIFVKPERTLEGDREQAAEETEGGDGLSVLGFVRKYPFFMLFVLAGTLMFFSHNALNDYLIQIIEPIGGDERTMGYMVMFAAVLELPTMALFTRLEKKFGCLNLLMLSGVMFFVKNLIMYFAGNIAGACVSQCCQLLAYAMFIPASAYFAELTMDRQDKTKGQAYVNMSITLGGVFSSLVCGRLLDLYSVRVMLLVAGAVGACGMVLGIVSLTCEKKKAG